MLGIPSASPPLFLKPPHYGSVPWTRMSSRSDWFTSSKLVSYNIRATGPTTSHGFETSAFTSAGN